MNFVRGEDSFVRAQWAARPFVWHIYPTDDGAHWVKMAAFLARYTAGLERGPAAAVTAMWEAWNRREGDGPGDGVKPSLQQAWAGFSACHDALTLNAWRWCMELATRRDLAAALVDFVDNAI